MKADEKVFYGLFLFSFLLQVSIVGFQTYFPILLREIDLDYLIIGVLAAVAGIGGAIFQLFVGAISDRWENSNKKKTLILSTLFLFFSFLVIFPSTSIALFFLISFVFGICRPLITTISNTIVTDITSKEKIGGRIGLFRSSVSIGWSVGGVTLGVVANIFSTRHVFLITSIVVLSALLTMILIPLKAWERAKSPVKFASQVKTYSNKLEIKSLGFIFFFIGVFLLGITVRSNSAYVSILFIENGVSKSLTGLIVGLAALLEALVFIFAGKLCDIIDEKKIMVVGSLAFAFIYVMYSQAYTFSEFFIIQMSKGFIFALFFASCLAFIGKFPSGRRGKAFGFYFLAIAIGGTLGPLVAGFVSDFYGLRNMYLSISIISVCAACLFILNVILPKGLQKQIKNKIQTFEDTS